MADNFVRVWKGLTRGEVMISLVGQASTTGGATAVAVIMNVPNEVVVAVAVTACIATGVMLQLILARRVVARGEAQLKRYQDSFGALWDYANEKGLIEHAEHDRGMREGLDELQASIYGRPPTVDSPVDDKPFRLSRAILRRTRK